MPPTEPIPPESSITYLANRLERIRNKHWLILYSEPIFLATQPPQEIDDRFVEAHTAFLNYRAQIKSRCDTPAFENPFTPLWDRINSLIAQLANQRAQYQVAIAQND